MHEVLYFHITLEPHYKNSGLISGGRIIFLAEVPVDVAKKPATNPADEKVLSQEAERLVVELLPIAMSGHLGGEGENVMRISWHAVLRPSKDLLEHTADAAKGGVRLWLLGANVA